MTDLVEIVARVLCCKDDMDPDLWAEYEEDARAAILETLRGIRGMDNPAAFAGAEKLREMESSARAFYKAEACAEVFEAIIDHLIKQCEEQDGNTLGNG